MTVPQVKQQAKVRTNTTKDSLCKLDASVITFSALWSAYKTGNPCDAKNENRGILFANQCAIRVSYALKKVGVTFKSYPTKRKCWIHPDADHILAAAELANWLEKQPFLGCRRAEDITGENWRDQVVGRTGIICFEDYYSASAGSGGDHIDLWNGSRMTDLSSGLRTRFRIVIPWNIWSDFGKSRKIRFFPIA
ncbi:type VI secretion system amidase effector protein Tae4 [Massilia sp. PAMC28688]|uniref:type VI secretion system amidase effector protein Tae4 n=1 Tax=Massilia sp. PAMC28688 TaxID=2861283 RepID=UPI001C62C2AD|nr:type VI secretion system amidase effector protein Tae4 [Massilia sp. PAMC28688]QYF95211.1 type VI secretion system amidase effector protein Tae4 [Massilia sp. PAMC28688]